MPGTEYVASDYLRQGGLRSGRSLGTPAHVDEGTRNSKSGVLLDGPPVQEGWVGYPSKGDGWKVGARRSGKQIEGPWNLSRTRAGGDLRDRDPRGLLVCDPSITGS